MYDNIFGVKGGPRGCQVDKSNQKTKLATIQTKQSLKMEN